MDIIVLPPCNDDLASNIIWILLISGVAGMAIASLLGKAPPFIRDGAGFLVALTAGGGMYLFSFCTDFMSIAFEDNRVTLSYLFPRPPVKIDYLHISHVDTDTTLKTERYGRSWKHRVDIKTDNGQAYHSVFVCIDKSKVGPDYQSAIYTKLHDTVENAVEQTAFAVVKSKLTSEQAKSIKPDTYAPMYVKLLRAARNLGAEKNANEDQRKQGAHKLNQYLALTKQGLGANHYAVGIVYRFIGGMYGMRGDLARAKTNFDTADRIFSQNSDPDWAAVNDRINSNGLTYTEFVDPKAPRTPNTVMQY